MPLTTRWVPLPAQPAPTDVLPGFSELGLSHGLVGALERAGISTPFAVQAATIPDILAGRDLLGRAATGSGKTLAFGLPLITRLEGAVAQPRRPRGLILVPTRELAMQVTDVLSPLAQSRGLSLRLVAGGLPIGKQISALKRGVDILVATPGRLVDLIDRRACELSAVAVTVLDEADHMADLGFLPVVRQLLDLTPSDGQRLLFSATLDGDVAVLAKRYLTRPVTHELSPVTATLDSMAHHVFRVARESKFDVVTEIAGRSGRTMLFVRTKLGADRLGGDLAHAGVRVAVLHGGLTQWQRNKALGAFRDGSVQVLVATDVAARGIHVDGVTLVLHVDPPADAKDYLHRSGRTARAGASGVVVLLTLPGEQRAVRRMLQDAGVHAEQRDVVTGDPQVGRITGARRPAGHVVGRPATRVEASRPYTDRVARSPHRSGGHPTSYSTARTTTTKRGPR